MTTLGQAINQWCEHRARMRDLNLVADSTWGNQYQIGQTLQMNLPASKPLADLRKSDVELYVGRRLKTCQPVTVRAEVNVLRQILNWCEDEQLLTVKPRLPTVRVPNVETSLPDDAAFEWVLKRLRPPVSLAVEFMMLTGLSPHEMERLQVRDYRHATIGYGSDQRGARVGIGQRPDFAVKTLARRRWVPLSDRSAGIWIELTYSSIDPAQHVFPSTECITKAIQRLRVDVVDAPAGVDLVTPKLARKWFASKVAGQHPEHVLQRLLGHSPGSKMTRGHYVRSTDQDTSNAVEGLKI